MKKILFVYDKMMVGGTTTALISLLRSIDYSRFSVDLLLYDTTGVFMKSIPDNVNVLQPAYFPKISKMVSPKTQKYLFALFDGTVVKSFLSWIKYRNTNKGNMRMIFFHSLSGAKVIASRRLKTHYDAAIGFIEGWSNHYVTSKKVSAEKRIVWVHPDYANSYLIPEVDRKSFLKADHIVVPSHKCMENLCNIFPECATKVNSIENIISGEFLRKRASEDNISIKKHSLDFCTVCRCDIWVKGLDRMINVLSRLKNEGILNDVHWHLIGGGNLEELKKLISVANLEENITLYGSIENPLPYVAQMDLFVLSSRYEGKPVSVSEALVLGIPCLVTAYESANEQVEHCVDGIVTENSEEGLYDGVKEILNNPDMLKNFKDKVSSRTYDTSQQIEKIYNLFY